MGSWSSVGQDLVLPPFIRAEQRLLSSASSFGADAALWFGICLQYELGRRGGTAVQMSSHHAHSQQGPNCRQGCQKVNELQADFSPLATLAQDQFSALD